MVAEPRQELRFELLFEGQSVLEKPTGGWAAAGSTIVHLVVAILTVVVPWGAPVILDSPRISADILPLVAPPRQLTQVAANTSKPSAEVNLQGLLSRPSLPTPPPRQPGMMQPAAPRKTFQAPPVPTPDPKPLIEAPKLEEGRREIGDLNARLSPPGIGNPYATMPTPQIQAEERPKLAFEKPGGATGDSESGAVKGRIPMPQRSTVEEAARQLARSGGGGLVVGDLGEGVGGLGESLNNPMAPPKNASSLELLSDPMGADFRPYLIRILSTVRRNWFAVLPESARMGRRGKVLIQFAINRDGAVPKLVIAASSGADALDRAAVAGVSASNPFPPLPDEYKGGQVRLQFTFLYNIR